MSDNIFSKENIKGTLQALQNRRMELRSGEEWGELRSDLRDELAVINAIFEKGFELHARGFVKYYSLEDALNTDW